MAIRPLIPEVIDRAFPEREKELNKRDRRSFTHISPDVFVSLNVPKEPRRDYYLVWKEGKAPDLVVEITSKSTKREDETKKLILYRDVLRVTEYFLFDPRAEYLDPPLQGFRLVGSLYVPISSINGRLPSMVTGLHLAREGQSLRMYDPVTGQRLLTPREARQAAEQRADEERQRAEKQRQRADEERQRAIAAEAARDSLAEENERLRREIEALRGR